MDNKDYKIALVVKNDGLEYDDRVRKEILTVQKLYPNIKFKIIAMLERNEEYEGVTSYGVPYKSVFIPARDKYPSAQKIILKAWQFYRATEKDLRNFDAVWLTNLDCVFISMFIRNKRILWDLHELPQQLMGNKIKENILKYLFKRAKVVVHANMYREKYLESIGLVTEPKKHYAIRNYPNFEDVDSEYDDKYYSFLSWKKNRRCVYLQGLFDDSRSPYESISAVLRTKELVAVVVGSCDDTVKRRLEEEYGEEFRNRILFMGRIAQLKIPQYSGQCYTTMVFYQNVEPNNYYCEANRFYQSIIMGLPVVVGDNPSMKELVDQYKFGISINDDGKDISKILKGLNQVIDNYEEFHQNCLKYRDKLLWENQYDVIKEIVEALFR